MVDLPNSGPSEQPTTIVVDEERMIIIIIQTFVTLAVSANILNLRRRQSLGEEDGGSEV